MVQSIHSDPHPFGDQPDASQSDLLRDAFFYGKGDTATGTVAVVLLQTLAVLSVFGR